MGLTVKQRGRAKFHGGVEMSVREYLVDGAIVAHLSHVAVLTKGSIGAYTLAAPARDGIVLTIISDTDFAHVVTATDLIADGVTGGPKDTATYAAFAGASAQLVSFGGLWNTVSLKAVTVAGA